MKISLNLEYSGWLDIKLESNNEEFLIPASSLTDVIDDITKRVASLVEGANETVIIIQTEPGEYRIRIIQNDTHCTFEVLEFDDNFCSDDIDKGIHVFKSEITLINLVRNVWMEMNKLKALGKVEYKYRWNSEFPEKAYQRLENAKLFLKIR
jgi:hypothetical protein